MANRPARKLLVLMFLGAAVGCFAQTTQPALQAAPSVAAPEELQHWLQLLTEWDGLQGDPYVAPVTVEVNLRVLPGLKRMGTTASAIAPDIAKLLAATRSNLSSLAQILIEMTPPTPPEDVASSIQATQSTDAAARALALARLARSDKPQAIGPLRDAARVYHDAKQRVIGTVALGYAGEVLPDIVASALAINLRDREREVRYNAAEGLARMCVTLHTRVSISLANNISKFMVDYLILREDPQGAVIILGCLPQQVAVSAMSPLRALVDDPKVADFNKVHARRLVARLQATGQGNTGAAVGAIQP